MLQDSLEFLFRPHSIAVVGASENPATYGCFFMHHLLNYGVSGKIYPINSKQPEIMGVKAYPRLEDVSADEWEENGFFVPPLPQEVRDELKERGSQLWDWIDNPADVSIMIGDPLSPPDVFSIIARSPVFDFIVADAEEDPPFGKEAFIRHLTEDMQGYVKLSKECDKPFLMVFDERSPGIHEMDSYVYRTRAELRSVLIKEGLPFFLSVDEAAKAVKELMTYCQRRGEGQP